MGNKLKHGFGPQLAFCHYWRSHAEPELTKFDKNGNYKGRWIGKSAITIAHYNKYIRTSNNKIQYLKGLKITSPEENYNALLLTNLWVLINVFEVAVNVHNKFVEFCLAVDGLDFKSD